MTRTNGPWTHTSDDSYMYQLSLVEAIASISLFPTFNFNMKWVQHSRNSSAVVCDIPQSILRRTSFTNAICCQKRNSPSARIRIKHKRKREGGEPLGVVEFGNSGLPEKVKGGGELPHDSMEKEERARDRQEGWTGNVAAGAAMGSTRRAGSRL